jgi:hypothetical protein
MEASISRSNRAKSALMMGAAFLLLFWISLMVASVIPVVGALVQAAVFFGSPFTWALSASGQLKGAHPYLLGFTIAAPYPLMGLIIGYAWPVEFSRKWPILRAIMARFALSCLLIWAVGAGLALFAAAHDS